MVTGRNSPQTACSTVANCALAFAVVATASVGREMAATVLHARHLKGALGMALGSMLTYTACAEYPRVCPGMAR